MDQGHGECSDVIMYICIVCACVHACSRELAELEDEACNGYLQTCIVVVLPIYIGAVNRSR